MKSTTKMILATLVATLLPVSLLAQDPSSEEIQALKKEIADLKAGQLSIQKELQEIQRLLTARQAPQPVREATIDLTGQPFKGSPDARLVMVEFSDYQCPYCFRHVEQTSPQIDREFVDTGKMTRYFFDLPLESIHKNAFGAALAANCAEKQGRFWEMHDKLFTNHSALEAGKLPGYAAQVGLDVEDFQACLADSATVQRVRGEMATAARVGAQGTPNFWIGFRDGKDPSKAKLVRNIRGAKAYADFKAVIEGLLAEEQ